MAKLTIEEAKVKLNPIKAAIEGLKGMGLEVPISLQQDFDRLMKIISGNSSGNLASVLNEKLAPSINKHAEFVALIANAVGTKASINVVVNTAEDGTQTISFEGKASGGGQKSGTSVGGGTKSSTPYNHYVVTVIGDLPGYKEKQGTFNTAAKTVEFILNGGANPLGLGAEYGKDNSMKRVLLGDGNDTPYGGGISAKEEFKANFKLECSYVPVVKKTAETPTAPTAPTADAPTA